jgi:alkanesulfonate monooxygenase SsuD/methylene tetrahydromethanopterin reductase-like flavin-dependent oxidoreductase (luciferase family)
MMSGTWRTAAEGLLVPDHEVMFGASLGQWNGADAADAAGRIRLATQADRDGLDLFTVADHPYFGDKLDAYALTGFLLGQTERITGMVTGQLADGWIPSGGSDWRSQTYRESRPRVDAAAAAVGRDPSEVVDVYNFGGRITTEPLAATRGEDGRWIGGSVQQWVDELTAAVLEHGAAGFIYRNADEETPDDQALARWATEIVPAVRAAITR